MRIDRLCAYLSRLVLTATAYKAKLLCSGIFVSGRNEASLLKEDLSVGGLALLRSLTSKVDYDNKTVTVSCFGAFKRTALYRPGLGSTLVLGSTVEALQVQAAPFYAWQAQNPRKKSSLPIGKESPQEIDKAQLAQVIINAFENRTSRTSAIVVLYKGEMIAERYAAGFSSETPLLGWSMAKSVVNALVGVLVKDGKLSLESKGLLPEWRSAEDPRREITLDQLLKMSSGLQFSEQYANPLSDIITMLFHTGEGAAYTARQPLQNTPGSTFHYSGGSTVLLCRIIREAIGGSLADYFSFPQRALFDRLGMASAVIEPDAAGTFVGSSFLYATARDWAKFGLLYLQDGCWDFGYAQSPKWTRILPEGWVAYSTAPSETAEFYGAHFWRGVPNSFTDSDRSRDDSWPKDAYLAAGYQGQFVTVVPSRDLVVVRLGRSHKRNSWDQVKFIAQVTDLVKPPVK